MSNKILIKRGLSSNLSNAGVVAGELKYATDTNKLYIGNGEENIEIGAGGSNHYYYAILRFCGASHDIQVYFNFVSEKDADYFKDESGTLGGTVFNHLREYLPYNLNYCPQILCRVIATGYGDYIDEYNMFGTSGLTFDKKDAITIPFKNYQVDLMANNTEPYWSLEIIKIA